MTELIYIGIAIASIIGILLAFLVLVSGLDAIDGWFSSLFNKD